MPYAKWGAKCAEAGLEVLTTCIYRSQNEQDALYAQGRTLPGRKVTWTHTSRHSETLHGKPYSSAWDFVPLKGGKPVWTATDPSWAMAGRIAEDLGLEWGGSWKRSRDLPHIQLRR